MSRYNKLVRDMDIVIPVIDNTLVLNVDTNYGNSLNLFSDNDPIENENVIVVEWGDGTLGTYNIGTGSISHRYTEKGKFTVEIKHHPLIGLKFFNQQIITELVRLSSMPNYNRTFLQCENLNKLHDNCLDSTGAETLINTFQNCYSLNKIPYNLFYKLLNLTNIDGLFKGCSIQDIPEKLFKNNFKLESLVGTFQNTQITILHSNLFKSTKNIKNMRLCFSASGLKEVEPNIFDNLKLLENASYLFYDCFSLETIPEDLFRYCTNLNDITRMFFNTKSLKHFPQSTFKYNNKIFKSKYVLLNSAVDNTQQIIWEKK